MIRLRDITPGEHLDFVTLSKALEGYVNVRDKISRLLKDGSLIRVKKGLYVLNRDQKGPIQKEVLANLIYGPSYISLKYALSYYSLIPERVEEITSVTTQKNKLFETPLGVFSYRYLALERYSIGIHIEVASDSEHFLIASPEKAICDVIAREKTLKTAHNILAFLIEDLRIDETDLKKLRLKAVREIALRYKKRSVSLLIEAIRGIR